MAIELWQRLEHFARRSAPRPHVPVALTIAIGISFTLVLFVVARYADATARGQANWGPWAVLVGGSLFTTLLGVYLLTALRRTTRIEHLRLEAESARAEAEALLSAITSLGIEAEPDAMLRTIVEQAASLLEVEGALYTVLRDGRLFIPCSWSNGEWANEPHEPKADGILASVFRSGTPHRSNYPTERPRARVGMREKLGIQSHLVMPLIAPDGEHLGLVSLYNSRRPEGFTSRDERLLGAFCSQASAILRRAQSTDARIRAERQAAMRQSEYAALLSASEQLNRALEPHEVLRRVAEVAATELQARGASIATYEDGSIVVRHLLEDGQWSDRSAELALNASICGWVVRHERAYRNENLTQDPRARRLVIAGRPVVKVLAVPIFNSPGGVIGVLSLYDRHDGLAFSDDDQRLAEGIAHHAALALERAQLHEELDQRVRERTTQLADANRALMEREQTLEDAQEYLRHLLAASPMVMIRADLPDVNVTYVSPNFARVFGYESDELVATRHFLLKRLHPQDRAGFLETVSREASQTGVGYGESEFRLAHKDGGYRWVHWTARFDADADGKRQRLLGYLLDVTERRQAEDALQLAKAEAERANEAKSEFLSRMSHELRTPLNAILGFAELMAMDEHSAEDTEAIQLIQRGGRHLLELINEVLDIARIEGGYLSLSLEPVSMQRTLREAISLIQPLAAAHEVHIRGPLDAEDYFVLADQQRLKQVLLNLLSNAVKYNRPAGYVNVDMKEMEDQRVQIDVRDEGVGIAADRFDRLFSPFDRLGAERTEVEGTGLGLALSKRLTEAMQGTISVESAVGSGTTVRLVFPEAYKTDTAYTALEQMPELEPDPVSEARLVLYIEDNVPNLRLMKRVLARRPGVRLLVAVQGGLGVELAREHRPDVILLDQHLPDIAGDEVLRLLKADGDTRPIPVIMISADATLRRVADMETQGIAAYLTKPLQVPRFLELLDTVLAREVAPA